MYVSPRGASPPSVQRPANLGLSPCHGIGLDMADVHEPISGSFHFRLPELSCMGCWAVASAIVPPKLQNIQPGASCLRRRASSRQTEACGEETLGRPHESSRAIGDSLSIVFPPKRSHGMCATGWLRSGRHWAGARADRAGVAVHRSRTASDVPSGQLLVSVSQRVLHATFTAYRSRASWRRVPMSGGRFTWG